MDELGGDSLPRRPVERPRPPRTAGGATVDGLSARAHASLLQRVEQLRRADRARQVHLSRWWGIAVAAALAAAVAALASAALLHKRSLATERVRARGVRGFSRKLGSRVFT